MNAAGRKQGKLVFYQEHTDLLMAEPTSMTVMMPRLEADRIAIELHSGKPSLDDVANETYLDSFVDLRPNKRG